MPIARKTMVCDPMRRRQAISSRKDGRQSSPPNANTRDRPAEARITERTRMRAKGVGPEADPRGWFQPTRPFQTSAPAGTSVPPPSHAKRPVVRRVPGRFHRTTPRGSPPALHPRELSKRLGCSGPENGSTFGHSSSNEAAIALGDRMNTLALSL